MQGSEFKNIIIDGIQMTKHKQKSIWKQALCEEHRTYAKKEPKKKKKDKYLREWKN